LAEYRQGRLESAIALMKGDASKAAWPGPRLVLAMAQQRSGLKEEARKTLAAAIVSYNWDDARADFNELWMYNETWIFHVLRREAETLIVPNLGAFFKGEYQPKDNDERLVLAQFCQVHRRPRAGVRLFSDAFAANPELADDLKTQHRYDAACYAALTASGQGKDTEGLDIKERTRWRKQALDWLRADLAAYEKQLESGKPESRSFVRQRLQHWQKDDDLVGLRDQEALAKLTAEERQACQKLWADVEAVLKKVQEKTK
jgi:hypothetical protein